jgi:hypothetical protein
MEAEQIKWEIVPSDVSKTDAIDAFTNLLNFGIEVSRAKTERVRIKAMEKIMLTEINRRYDFYEKLLIGTFSERNKIIEKHFDVIDKGMKDNDSSLILMGLTQLSDIVKTSPFANLLANENRLKEMLDPNMQLPAL